MKLYCVLSWITVETSGRKRGYMGNQGLPRMENKDRKENYYTKLDTARSAYDFRVKEISSELSCCYRGERRVGRVKLFVPNVSENGALMDWPTDKYIAEYECNDQGEEATSK